MPDSTGQANTSSIEDLENLRKKAAGVRQPLEPEWYLNVAAYYGNQWVKWNRGRIDRPKVASWRVQVVDNRVLPIAYGRIAKKIKQRPQFVVTADDTTEDSLAAAEIGLKSLDDDWRQINLRRKLFNALMWAEVCSAGFWKIYWDKTKGDYSEEYVIDPDGEVFLDPKTNRPIRASQNEAEAVLSIDGFNTQTIATGNVCVDVLSPFHLLADPLVDESGAIEECEFIIEEHIRSVDYIRKHYDVDVKPDTDAPTGIAESRMFPYLNAQAAGGSTQYQGVTVYELYGKTGSQYGQNGKRAVWTKEQQLLEEGLDKSPFSGCPYVMFSGVEVPGRFWPTSITSQVRPINVDLNKVQSQIRENANRFGNPALMSARQANVAYTGLPGERIYYDATVPDAKPEYLHAPEMPGYVQNQLEIIERSLTEISGIHEVSKASVPAGVTAASAINLLQEADDTRLGPEIEDMEIQIGKAGQKILRLRAEYQDDERILRSVGEDGEWDIATFRGHILRKLSVEVQAGSGMPRSNAARQAAMQDILSLMLQYGIEIEQRDLRKFLREYNVGGLESMFNTLGHDEQQIRREHNIMKSGQPIDINDFDDHDMHIEGHDELRKTRWYYMASPDIKQIINLHVHAHMEARQKIIDAQVKAAQENANSQVQ